MAPGTSAAPNDGFWYGTGVSDAGKVVGYGRTSYQSQYTAYIWDQGTGYTMLPIPSGYSSVTGCAITGDGSLVYGNCQATSWPLHSGPVLWKNGTVSPLFPPTSESVFIGNASYDGSVLAGTYEYRGYVWTEAGGIEWLPVPAGTLSADGRYIVGSTSRYAGGEAFRYDRLSHTTMLLGRLSDNDASSGAFDVTADGKTILGRSGGTLFVWNEDTGMRSLVDVLASSGLDVSEWVFTSALISDDGNFLAGNGIRSSNEGYFAEVDFGKKQIVPVPEPASYALCAVLLCLGLAGYKRYRGK
jgi:hypothetical protein